MEKLVESEGSALEMGQIYRKERMRDDLKTGCKGSGLAI
jgi:hypothetical protein